MKIIRSLKIFNTCSPANYFKGYSLVTAGFIIIAIMLTLLASPLQADSEQLNQYSTSNQSTQTNQHAEKTLGPQSAERNNAAQSLFDQFVISGGPIVWFILIPLSFITIYLASDLIITVRAQRLLAGNQLMNICKSIGEPLEKAAEILSRKSSLSARAAAEAILDKANSKTTRSQLSEAAIEKLSKDTMNLSRKVEWAGVIGSVAPMIGLFGTVFGMIKAFNILGISAGQPRPGQLASAISIALVTTFWGLLVAIPALTLHGIFSSKLDKIFSVASYETEQIIKAIAESLKNNTGSTKQSSQKNSLKKNKTLDKTSYSLKTY